MAQRDRGTNLPGSTSSGGKHKRQEGQMPQTPREANRGLRWFEPIQSGCLVLSLALNAYLGVLAKRESDRAEETLQRIKIEKEAPAVQATRIVISGDVIRALMTGEKTTLEIYG